jgi:hypothetical protein
MAPSPQGLTAIGKRNRNPEKPDCGMMCDYHILPGRLLPILGPESRSIKSPT